MTIPTSRSLFRHPPALSAFGLLSAVTWLVRRLGLGLPFLRTFANKMLSKDKATRSFDGYAPKPEDVFCAVFSKSGTNWLMQMVVQAAWEGEAEFDHIHSVVAWPGTPFSGIAPLDATEPWSSAPHPVHAIKTNAPYSVLPIASDAKFITVLRDPKEVVVSAYHFLTGLFALREQVPPDAFFEDFAHGALASAWAEHTASVWAQRERPNVLVLRFDRMKEDLPAAVDAVTEFLGIDLGPEARDRVVERCGFAWMKAHEDQFGPPIMRFAGGRPRGRMLRRGATGGSSEMLSREQQARVDRLVLGQLEALGSDFPYREFFGVVE